jgi:hypothetical protein
MKIIGILSIIIFSMTAIGSLDVVTDNHRKSEHVAAYVGLALSVFGIVWAYVGSPDRKRIKL